MKKDAGLFKNQGFPDWEDIEKNIGSSAHKRAARKVAAESITLVKDESSMIPIKPEKINKLSHIILSVDDRAKDYLEILSKDINRTVNNTDNIFINYE